MDILTGKKRGNRPIKVRVKTKYQTLQLDIDIQSKKTQKLHGGQVESLKFTMHYDRRGKKTVHHIIGFRD